MLPSTLSVSLVSSLCCLGGLFQARPHLKLQPYPSLPSLPADALISYVQRRQKPFLSTSCCKTHLHNLPVFTHILFSFLRERGSRPAHYRSVHLCPGSLPLPEWPCPIQVCSTELPKGLHSPATNPISVPWKGQLLSCLGTRSCPCFWNGLSSTLPRAGHIPSFTFPFPLQVLL